MWKPPVNILMTNWSTPDNMFRKTVLFAVLAVMIPFQAMALGARVLKIDFKNPIADRVAGKSPFNLSFLTDGTMSSPVSLLSYVRAIDAAAADPSIGMIYMTPDNIQAGVAQIEEIRAALKRFRESGKTVVAYCTNLDNMSYYLASVADKIILDPASESILTGLASQQIFYKDLLDALGIEVQLIRHGKFKGAGEAFTRSSSSPENRLQSQALINSLWNTMSAEIACSRGFSQDELNGWIENLEMFHADDFKQKGLVDEVLYRDEVDDYICNLTGCAQMWQVGFVKINRYAAKLRKGNRKNRIAVVYAEGEIVDKGGEDDIVGVKLARTLRKIRKNNRIKAVVLRVNSPGGSVQASETIRRELELLGARKPVIASYGNYAASGGYWISAGSEFIFTDRTTTTGSIGVFALVPSAGKAIRKNLKVNVETLGTSSHSDMSTFMRKMDDREVAYVQGLIERIYDDFTGLVADGRHMSKDSVDAIGQGRVWSGADGLGIGLVDSVGGLSDAIRYASARVGLGSMDYQIDEYPVADNMSILQLLSGGEADDPTEELTTSINEMPSLSDIIPVVSRMRKLKSISVSARMESVMDFL